MQCKKCYGCNKQEDINFIPPQHCTQYQDAYKDKVDVEYRQIRIKE